MLTTLEPVDRVADEDALTVVARERAAADDADEAEGGAGFAEIKVEEEGMRL